MQQTLWRNIMDNSTTKSNQGGRKSFKRGSEVRLLTVDGRISDEVYFVDPLSVDHEEYTEFVKSDRNGIIRLQHNQSSINVLFRRILPLHVDGRAPVIESNGKNFTICPKCGNVLEVFDQSESNCNTCGIFQLYWLGVKPMSQQNQDATQTIDSTGTDSTDSTDSTVQETPTPAKAVKRPPSTQRDNNQLCLDDLAKLENCELWTKNGVKFDHASVDVNSHALIYNGDNARKYCFNTYDGSLGKKAKELKIEEFVANSEIDEKKPWHYIKDLAKHKEELTKKGYSISQ